jgi:hypothetical protein
MIYTIFQDIEETRSWEVEANSPEEAILLLTKAMEDDDADDYFNDDVITESTAFYIEDAK